MLLCLPGEHLEHRVPFAKEPFSHSRLKTIAILNADNVIRLKYRAWLKTEAMKKERYSEISFSHYCPST